VQDEVEYSRSMKEGEENRFRTEGNEESDTFNISKSKSSQEQSNRPTCGVADEKYFRSMLLKD